MLLQKKDNEGFGFVLRGAKGEIFSKIHMTMCYFYILRFQFFYILFVSTYLIQSHLSKSHSATVSFAAQTPIEEFTPTPAFPALQYLESVDEGGVAWRAGLRMGDFLIEVRQSCQP